MAELAPDSNDWCCVAVKQDKSILFCRRRATSIWNFAAFFGQTDLFPRSWEAVGSEFSLLGIVRNLRCQAHQIAQICCRRRSEARLERHANTHVTFADVKAQSKVQNPIQPDARNRH